MARLVDDLLSLSRIEQHMHLRPATPVDLTLLVAHIVDTLSQMAEDRGVAINLDLQPNVVAPGDRDELARVIENSRRERAEIWVRRRGRLQAHRHLAGPQGNARRSLGARLWPRRGAGAHSARRSVSTVSMPARAAPKAAPDWASPSSNILCCATAVGSGSVRAWRGNAFSRHSAGERFSLVETNHLNSHDIYCHDIVIFLSQKAVVGPVSSAAR